MMQESLQRFIFAVFSIMGIFANPNMDANTENATGDVRTQEDTDDESQDEDTDSSDTEKDDVKGAHLEVDTSLYVPTPVHPSAVSSACQVKNRSAQCLPHPTVLTEESQGAVASRNGINTPRYDNESLDLHKKHPDELTTDARDLDDPADCCHPIQVASDHQFVRKIHPECAGCHFEKEYHELEREGDEVRKKVMDREKVLKFLDFNALKSKPKEVMLYDAAVVYDKDDYAEVEYFIDELKDICLREIGEELRIELYDSEAFEQSKVLVVEDVFKKCSVILVYLTPNSVSEEFRLFIEEMVGLSRLALNNPDLRANHAYNNRKWILKPVHTQAPEKRTYKIPMGLLTLIGIEWYDKWSPHTRNQIKEILKNAIHERKRNEERQGIESHFPNIQKLTGRSDPSPPLYSHQMTVHSYHPSLPYRPQRLSAKSSPRISHDPHRVPNHPSVRSSSTPVWAPDYEPVQPPRRDNFFPTVPLQAPQQRDSDSSVARQTLSFSQQAPQVRLQQQMEETHSPSYQQIAQIDRRHHSEPIFQTARIRNSPQSFQVLNTQSLANLQLNPQQTFAYGDNSFPLSTEAQVYSPFMTPHFARPPTPEPVSGARPLAQDQTFQRNARISSENPASFGDFTRDRRNDAPPSSDLSVVSRVTGKLIVNSNLSTGDVEIDTNPSAYTDDERKDFRKDESKHTRDRQRRGRSSSYSESSGESESDDELNIGLLHSRRSRKTKGKTVNIVGCGNVQIGKGNRISQRKKNEKIASKNSKGQSNRSSSSKDKDDSLLASEVKRPESKFESVGATSSNTTDKLAIRGETTSGQNESMYARGSSDTSLTENMSIGLKSKPLADKSVPYLNNLSQHSEPSDEECVFQIPEPLPLKYQLNIRKSEHEDDSIVNFENNLDEDDDDDSMTDDITDDELFGGEESSSVSSNAESSTGVSLLNRVNKNMFTPNSKEFLQPWQRFLRAVNSVSAGNVDEVD